MGFYGNIGNTTTSSFTFDKIYPNRQRMDASAAEDGVFIGRYVLIEYDMNDKTFYTQLYIKTYFYIDEECQNEADISNINDGQIVFTEENGIKTYYQVKIEDSNLSFVQVENISDGNIDKQVYKKIVFYHDFQCTEVVNASDVNDGEIIYTMENDIAVFYKVKKEKIEEENNISIYKLSFIKVIEEQTDSYLQNYLIDKDSYSTSDGSFGRGYDSTVWQKVFTNNEEKYVLIAELNSVVPTFDLTIDAPTINPVVPHFDADSSNVYYKLHVQPNWGFRVKEAENGLSDFDVSYHNSLNAPTNASSDYIGTKSNYAGAIYINKAGFDVNESNHVDIENIKNEIALTPTGKSGAQYNDHNITNPSQTSVQNDIQELSIILPSIGNTVATLWDIAYGEERNQDISWDSTLGLRLVKENSEGNGFTYSTDDVETIAGCINSVHDLMGMIVESQIIDNDAENKVDVHDVDSDKIYYDSVGKKYYIKEKSYKWDPNKKAEPTDDEYFISEYNEVDLINYYPETYYTKNANGDFIFSMSDNAVDGVNYYEIEATKHTLFKWNANNYYYQDEDNNYKLDTQDHYTQDRIYYSKDNFLSSAVKECSYFFSDDFKHIDTGEKTVDGKKLYYGPFYVFEEENGPKKCYPRGKDIKGNDFAQENENLPNALIKYSISWGLDTEGNEGDIYTINEETIIDDGFEEYSSSENYYTRDENDNYILLTEGIPNDYYNQIYNKSNSTYYTINTNNIASITGDDNVFFNPETIYHENIDNNYIRIISDNLISEKEYYSVVIENTYNTFYKPNKYYYETDNGYKLDNGQNIADDRQYYELLEPYIGPNYNGTIYAPGEKINTEIKLSDYPESERQSIIDHVYYRQDDWAFKELPGFARTLNTIHGLILRINNLIKFNDKLTRDLSTVQGCINKLNDIIHTIGALKPNHFIAVDEAGHMVSMQPTGDDWINVTVNKDNQDQVIISHKPSDLPPNKYESSDIILTGFGDSFKILNYTTDSAGHLISSGENEITIPKGQLTNKDAQTSSNVVTKIDFTDTTGVIEVSRQDISSLYLNGYSDSGGNSDIASTDTLGQALSKLQTQIIDEENARVNAINDLDMTSNEDTTKFISKIKQENGKVSVERAPAGTLELGTGYAVASESAAISATDSINSAVGKLEYKLNILNAGSTQEGSVAYQIAQIVTPDGGNIDKLEEIAAWIVSDTTGAAKMNSDIKANTDAIIELKALVGDTAVAIQITNAIAEALTSGNTNKYALASELNALANRVKNLEDLIDSDKVAKWETQADWNESIETSLAFIKNKPNLDNVIRTTTKFTYSYNDATTQMTIEGLLAYIASLEARIAALELQPGPEPSEPDSNPEDNA